MALGLPQLKILWQQELEGHIEVTVIYRWCEARCILWFQGTVKLQVQGISGKGSTSPDGEEDSTEGKGGGRTGEKMCCRL